MSKLLLVGAAFSSLLLCSTARAAEPAATAAEATAAVYPVRAGGTLKSADGRRIGYIDQIVMRDGQPFAAQVILDTGTVSIPAATITSVDRSHFVTSMTYKAVNSH